MVGVAGGRSTVAELPHATSVARAIAKLERDPEVEFAAPELIAPAALDALRPRHLG